MIKAIIFDMDGVIFDTERVGFEATKKLFKEYGVKIKYSDVTPFFGRGAKLYVKSLKKKYRVNEDLEKLLNKRGEIIYKKKKSLRVFPGIKKLITKSKNNKIKLALATSATLPTVKINFKLAKLNLKLFDVIVTKNEIKSTKPNPEIFLKAINLLKVKPKECIIIEDSIAGVEAGIRAKAKVIAITNSFPKSKLRKADLIVNSAKKINTKNLKCL